MRKQRLHQTLVWQVPQGWLMGKSRRQQPQKVLGKEPKVERGPEEEERRGACRFRGQNHKRQHFHSSFHAWCQCLSSRSFLVHKSLGNSRRRRFFLNGWASSATSTVVSLAAHSPVKIILISASWEGHPGIHCRHGNIIHH